jgi:multidrug efflux pump subunit AcrB
VRYRLRPILMSTLTSLFGMLPLLLMPGAGTELYRGLAAVIVGGLSVSTIFTLVLLPSLLRIGEDARQPAGAGSGALTTKYASPERPA